jgi:hypothetical protein
MQQKSYIDKSGITGQPALAQGMIANVSPQSRMGCLRFQLIS